MKKIIALLLTAILTLSCCAALADEIWTPGTTVYVDVGARAGGGTDLMVRYITAGLAELNPGVNFVVVNYDVADVGSAHAAYADKDGLNLTVLSAVNVINYHSGSSAFDPETNFDVVGKVVAGGPQAYIAAPSYDFHSMEDVVNYIRSGEKKLNIGVSLGSMSHFAFLNTFNAIDPELNNMVNYVQSGGEADKLTNIASGSISFTNASMNNAMAYEADGKLTVVGIVGPEMADRAATSALVGVELGDQYKSMPEQGINYTLNAGSYVAIPAGTDPAIIEYINGKLLELEKSEAFVNGMNVMGSFISLKNVEESVADFKAEAEEFTAAMDALGMLAVK